MPSKYKFGACYVHQKPYVMFGNGFKFRCELGDLLVLVKKKVNGVAAFNSALFQLKKTVHKKDRYSVPICGGEDKQLTLYTKWGRLKIDLKSERGTFYDITPHVVSQGGSYMFIRPDRIPTFVVSVPKREMRTTYIPSLGSYLFDMVEWRCGRSIASKEDLDNRGADGWSRLIWRVIDLLENACCSCKRYGNVTRDNGCGSLAFLRGCHEIESIGESENGNSDPDGSFGVLFIECLDGFYERESQNPRDGKEQQ